MSDEAILSDRDGTADPDADLTLDGIVDTIDDEIFVMNEGRNCASVATDSVEQKMHEPGIKPQLHGTPQPNDAQPVEESNKTDSLPESKWSTSASVALSDAVSRVAGIAASTRPATRIDCRQRPFCKSWE